MLGLPSKHDRMKEVEDMLPITKVTVPMLRTMANDILGTDVKVPSKILKADLYALVRDALDALHIQAANMDADRTDRKAKVEDVAAGYRALLGKSYGDRMSARFVAYHVQNGHGDKLNIPEYGAYDSRMMRSFLTPAQRRRIEKKYNAQYGKLQAQLVRA